jgi:hypothetical protein
MIGLLLAISGLSAILPAGDARLVPIAPGWAGNTVNVVVFRKNSVTTHGGIQYTAFYDQDGAVVLASHRLPDAAWLVHKTQFSGNVRDAHNDICIAVDGSGVLHLAWGHHDNSLHYARGVSPGSLELAVTPMTGLHENRVTYPEFYNMPDGGLLFIYRDGASGNGNLVMNRYDLHSGTWRQIQSNLIDGQGHRNAYWQAAVDAAGVIHVSWVWRESSDVATNHDLCYACSADGGVTWHKSGGEAYTLPITVESAEIAVKIPQKHELINQTSMTTDSRGHPYIATYWRDEGQEIPQYHVVYFDGAKWHLSQVGEQTISFRLGGAGTKRIPLSRPQILIGPTNKAYLLFRDSGRGDKVSVGICDDLAVGRWRVEDLTDSSVGQWEPTFDANLWREQGKIDVFVQKAEQRDGEGVADVAPEMAYILEWTPR